MASPPKSGTDAPDILIAPLGFETKRRILRAVDRPIRSLSVADICAAAHISRQTFYNHFDSKNHVSFWFNTFSRTHFLDAAGRTLTWEQSLLKHLCTLSQEARPLHFAAQSDELFSNMNRVKALRRDALVLTLRKYQDIEPDDEMLFYIRGYANLEVDCCADWFQGGLKYPSASELACYLEACIPRPLYEVTKTPRSEWTEGLGLSRDRGQGLQF